MLILSTIQRENISCVIIAVQKYIIQHLIMQITIDNFVFIIIIIELRDIISFCYDGCNSELQQ